MDVIPASDQLCYNASTETNWKKNKIITIFLQNTLNQNNQPNLIVSNDHFLSSSSCLMSPVDVTLDPATAAGWLALSPDGKKVHCKNLTAWSQTINRSVFCHQCAVVDEYNDGDPQVSLGSQQRRLSLPHDPRRFDSCVAVLGKQSFTSGRRYWVVQVGVQKICSIFCAISVNRS